MKLWTFWWVISLSLSVLWSLQSQKVYLWLWQFLSLIPSERWKKRTIWWDFWLPVKPWVELTIFAQIRQVLWLRTRWLWQDCGVKEEFCRLLARVPPWLRTLCTTLQITWHWTQTLCQRWKERINLSNWVTRQNAHCWRWHTSGVTISETSERNTTTM